MEKAKVLLKDLPFGRLSSGTVIRSTGGKFIIEHGHMWYNGLMYGSHNGHTVFNDSETSILKAIWGDKEWFAESKLSQVKYSRTNTSITLSFSVPLDLSDVERIAKGIQATLQQNYKDTVESMGWSGEETNIKF